MRLLELFLFKNLKVLCYCYNSFSRTDTSNEKFAQYSSQQYSVSGRE